MTPRKARSRSTAKPRLTIREVEVASDPAVSKGHRLLWRSFHKAELVGRGEWRNALQEQEQGLLSDIRWHFVVAEMGGSLIGVATGSYLGNVNTGFVGYVAVSPAARGLGVGPRLRARLRSRFRRDAQEILGEPLRAIMGEVRRDNPWLRTLVRRDQVLALDLAYRQPRLQQGGQPVPLVLYYEPLDRGRHRLPAGMIRRLLYTIWRRVYRIGRPLANPVFRRMLRELEGRKFLGALSLDDLPPPADSLLHRGRR